MSLYNLYGNEVALNSGHDAHFMLSSDEVEVAPALLAQQVQSAPPRTPIKVGWGLTVYAEDFAGMTENQVASRITRLIEKARSYAGQRIQDRQIISRASDTMKRSEPGSFNYEMALRQKIVAEANLKSDRFVSTVTPADLAAKSRAKQEMTVLEAANRQRRLEAQLLEDRKQDALRSRPQYTPPIWMKHARTLSGLGSNYLLYGEV
jgi:hypothetical protein